MFLIVVHERDQALLELIQRYFKGVGKIPSMEKIQFYRVSSLKDLMEYVIPHLTTLITQKRADFELF